MIAAYTAGRGVGAQPRRGRTRAPTGDDCQRRNPRIHNPGSRGRLFNSPVRNRCKHFIDGCVASMPSLHLQFRLPHHSSRSSRNRQLIQLCRRRGSTADFRISQLSAHPLLRRQRRRTEIRSSSELAKSGRSVCRRRQIAAAITRKCGARAITVLIMCHSSCLHSSQCRLSTKQPFLRLARHSAVQYLYLSFRRMTNTILFHRGPSVILASLNVPTYSLIYKL